MPRLILTHEAYCLVLAQAPSNFRNDSTRLPDGSYSVPVTDDMMERLDGIRHHDETDSALVTRIAVGSRGKPN